MYICSFLYIFIFIIPLFWGSLHKWILYRTKKRGRNMLKIFKSIVKISQIAIEHPWNTVMFVFAVCSILFIPGYASVSFTGAGLCLLQALRVKKTNKSLAFVFAAVILITGLSPMLDGLVKIGLIAGAIYNANKHDKVAAM